MVKAEVKTPNKRKSIAIETASSKKVKVENGKTSDKPFTPKKQNQSPKNNQPASGQKSHKKNKQIKVEAGAGSPKGIKPFAGTKQLKKERPQWKSEFKAGGVKLAKEKQESANESKEPKKKRRGHFGNLVAEVRSKEGSKDAETLKKLNEKIEAITSRKELTKTAKRKLSLLQKLKVICEEGSAAASDKSRIKVESEKKAAAKIKAEKKSATVKTEQPKKKQVVKAAPLKAKDEEDEDEDSDAEESAEEEQGDSDDEAEDEESDEVEGEEDEESDEVEGEEDDDDDEEDDDDSFEEVPAPKEKSPIKRAITVSNIKQEDQRPNKKQPSLDQLKKTELVKKGQKRFVLFVGNIPFDTTKQDLVAHFSKVGDIAHIRLPTEKGSNKPRGFGYVEVKNETAYEKCLSLHHSQLKGRRINVLYTQGGKKKGDDQKKEIKAKNMKLHALRRQGKLAGSVKQTQKRSFRRNKGKNIPADSES